MYYGIVYNIIVYPSIFVVLYEILFKCITLYVSNICVLLRFWIKKMNFYKSYISAIINLYGYELG